MKLIAEWKQSYKLYSVQIGLAITLLSIADGVMRAIGAGVVPAWVYTASAVLLLIARNVQQFLGEE